MVEQQTVNLSVVGSNPSGSAIEYLLDRRIVQRTVSLKLGG